MKKVHLGCGKRNFGDDWDHIDGSSYSHIKYHDIINLPYKNNEVDIIYASHVLEYFDRDEALEVLQKWYNVLKPGGTLRLAVPDFEASAKLYVEKNVPLSYFVGMFYGKWKMTDKDTIYHKTIYDFESISTILDNAGFVDCKKWDHKK